MSQLTQSSKEVEGLKASLREREQTIKEMETKADTAEHFIAELNEKISGYEQTVTDLRICVLGKDEEVLVLKSKCEAYEEQTVVLNAQLLNDRSGYVEKEEKLNAQLKEKCDSVERLQQNLSTAESKCQTSDVSLIII